MRIHSSSLEMSIILNAKQLNCCLMCFWKSQSILLRLQCRKMSFINIYQLFLVFFSKVLYKLKQFLSSLTTCNLKSNKIWVLIGGPFSLWLTIYIKWLIMLSLLRKASPLLPNNIFFPFQYQPDNKLSLSFLQLVGCIYLVELISGTWVLSFELWCIFKSFNLI